MEDAPEPVAPPPGLDPGRQGKNPGADSLGEVEPPHLSDESRWYTEHTALLISTLKWSLLGAATGICVGEGTRAFLWSLGASSRLVARVLAGPVHPYYLLPGALPACVWLIRSFAPSAKGHGTEAVIAAVHQRSGKVDWKVAFAASRAALAAEILALRHQHAVLERSSPARLPLTCWDRALWAFLLRHWSGWKDSMVLVKPDTVIAWHRRAFRPFWRRRSATSRPTTRADIRRLIRQMAQENATWGAPRIHGELLKLGYVVGERTVSHYLARIRPEPTKPGSQTWATFLKNHARDIAAIDMFVVPTIRFQVLYVFIILGLERRRLVFANVTANPTAEWLESQPPEPHESERRSPRRPRSSPTRVNIRGRYPGRLNPTRLLQRLP
jgi:hypothetical protein